MTEKTELRIKGDQYFAQFPNIRKTTFHCPHCEADIPSLKPLDDENDHTSFSVCPDCGREFYKIVKPTGEAITNRIGPKQ